MKRLAFVWHLPLLIRELTELAARRRTYNVRLTWAVVLFAATFLLLYSNVLSTDGANALGQGRPVFLRLVTMQLWAVYLLMPAMVCGVISGEKERNSLSLLMLTTLSPWQIVIQKLFSRLIPMVSLLFISFPLMAIAFGHGGVTSSLLWSGILLLLLACLQVGSFAVMCSAFFRTTYEAFVASYLLFLLLCWMVPPLFAPNVFEEMAMARGGHASGMMVLIMASIAGFLAMARVLLESRAFVPPRNYVLEVFQALDRMYLDMNKATGGIVLVRDHHLLPGEKHPKNRWERFVTCFAFWWYWSCLCWLCFSCSTDLSAPVRPKRSRCCCTGCGSLQWLWWPCMRPVWCLPNARDRRWMCC